MLKKLLSVIAVTALLGSALINGSAPAIAAACTIDGQNATCVGPSIKELARQPEVRYLKWQNAGKDLSAIAGLPQITWVDVEVDFYADVRPFLELPQLEQVAITVDTEPMVVRKGKEFTVPSIKFFDGNPFEYDINDAKSAWKLTEKTGFNRFRATDLGTDYYVQDWYMGKQDGPNRSFDWYYYPEGIGKITVQDDLKLVNPKLTVLRAVSNGNDVSPGAVVTLSGQYNNSLAATQTKCVWYRDGVVVKDLGRGKNTGLCGYEIRKADSGKKITVVADHSTNYHRYEDAILRHTDTLSGTYNLLDVFKHKASISGANHVGSSLKALISKKVTGAKFSYQWLRDGKAIANATKSTYTLAASDVNKRIGVRVDSKKVGYFSDTQIVTGDSKVKKGTFKVTKAPKISGKSVFGNTLKVDPGSRSAKPSKYTYQWLRDGKTIKGATKAAYKLGTADLSKRISVRVTATRAGFTTQESTTGKTKAVAKATFKLKKSPSVSGSVKVGKKLKAKPGTWSPKPSSYKYQWYRSGAAIKKATKNTYKVTKRDRGAVLYVKVTAKKRGYIDKSAQSKVK